MPTPLIIVPPVRFGLRNIDEQGRFVEDAEEMMGKKRQQESHMRAWRNMGDQVRELTKDLDIMSKVGIEHVGGEGPR